MTDQNSVFKNKETNISEAESISSNEESQEIIENATSNSDPKWINNKGEEVKEVFGFNENAELVNARVAMIGFIMLIITELAFGGEAATKSIFGIN
mgnify:CR=1 FL=1